jgi:two-component sensor histidine kinase
MTPPPDRPRSHLRGPWLWRGLGIALAVLFLVRLVYFVAGDLMEGEELELAERLFLEVTGAVSAVPLLALLAWLARRAPLVRGDLARAAAVHAAAFVVLSAFHTATMLVVREALGPPLGLGEFPAHFSLSRFAYEGANDVFPIAALLGGLALADNLLAARERERREAALERSLLEAELRGLRLQLQPHFLFNALNTISSTMYDDPAAADAQLGQLAELLRTSLRTTHAHEVAVAEELALLDQYLGLMGARFGDRFVVDVRATEDARGCLVPSMLLQPLVENAARHGALASRGRGRVAVTVTRDGGRLRVRVHDDGPGLTDGADPLAGGTGLSATARRLRLLYGDAHALHAGPAPDGGFEVRLEIPARQAAAASEPAFPVAAGGIA